MTLQYFKIIRKDGSVEMIPMPPIHEIKDKMAIAKLNKGDQIIPVSVTEFGPPENFTVRVGSK